MSIPASPAAPRGVPSLSTLPVRPGPKPRTTERNPHQQRSDLAPIQWQAALRDRILTLPGVVAGDSRVSVDGARAFYLLPQMAGGPPKATLMGGEFAHMHPPTDGSLHVVLPPEAGAEMVARGWGEPHPMARRLGTPPRIFMVYGPRDLPEVEIVWSIVRASYAYARGSVDTA